MTEEQDKAPQRDLTQAQALCDRAGEMLQQEDADLPQVAESLRQATDALPDPLTTEARRIQDEAAEVWRELVVRVEDLHQAEAYLREGANRFDTHEAGRTFQRMRAHVQSALATQRALKLTEEQVWPAWFEGRQGKIRLSELLSTLDALLEEKSWPLLVEHARRQCRVLYTQMLPPYLAQISEQAHKMARERDFARAQQQINAYLDFIPQTHLHHLPETVEREGMLALNEAVESRQQVEVSIWTGLVRLTTQEISFRTAFQDFHPILPDHPDVWVGDLKSLIADLNQAAEIETALDPVPTEEDIFIDPSQWEKLVRSEFTIQEEVPAFLASSDPQLVAKLQARIADLESRIQRAPQEIIATLEGLLDYEPPTELIEAAPELVTHYWQVIWWLEQGLFQVPDQVEAGHNGVNRARGSLITLAAYAGNLFAGMQDQTDLAAVDDTLGTLRILNQDLARFPGKKNTDLPEMDPPLPPEPLETWGVTIQSWRDITQRGDSGEEWGWIAEEIARILDDLNQLKGEVWPALELSPWEEGSTPAKIEAEGGLILALIAALEAVNEQVDDLPSLEAAAFLEERLGASGYLQQPHEVWLLLPYHAVLLTSIQRLRQAFEEGIDAQIGIILDDLEGGPERLREHILAQAKTPELAELAYYSIKTYAAEQAESKSAQDGSRPGALALWDSIRQATQPWAGAGGEPVQLPRECAERWRRLHREATWEYRKEWAFNKRLEIAAGFGFLILVALIAFVIIPGLARFRNEPQPTLVGVLPTAISTIQPAAANATDPIETSTPPPSPTEVDLGGTTTAQAEATQEDLLALAGTSTAQAGGTATVQAGVCLDEAAYDFTILEEAELTPPRGTYYVSGTTPFPVTIAWQVRNSGICAWEQLIVEAQDGSQEVDYEVRRAANSSPVSAEEPVRVDDVVTIVLRFGIEQVAGLSGETWRLVPNGIPLPGSPPLSFDAQDWIISVTPPSSRP